MEPFKKIMSIKEKIEENVIVWLLGTLLAGFGSGIATYKAVIEIAGLRVVPSSEAPDKLKGEMEKLKVANSEISVKYDDCEKQRVASALASGYADQNLTTLRSQSERTTLLLEQEIRNLRAANIDLAAKYDRCQKSEHDSGSRGEVPEDFRWRSEDARQLVVRITAPIAEGAGIVVASADNGVYIVTAKHIVFRQGKAVSDLSVQFRQASASPFRVDFSHVRVDPREDIAAFFLDLKAQRNLRDSLEEALSTVEIQSIKTTSLGEFLHIAGHSSAGSWQVSPPGDYKFYKKEGEKFLMWGSCPQGHDGGAVYGKSWKLLGMAIDEERPFCRAYSMPILKAFLARHWAGLDLGFKQ